MSTISLGLASLANTAAHLSLPTDSIPGPISIPIPESSFAGSLSELSEDSILGDWGGPGSGSEALVRAFMMIIVSEIGDKTFLIAALLAMRHPRMLVFAGATASLLLMSFLSASLGHLLPSLLPKQLTQTLAALLFLVFGTRMAREGLRMEGGREKVMEEMREAEAEIGVDEEEAGAGASRYRMNGNGVGSENEHGGWGHNGDDHADGRRAAIIEMDRVERGEGDDDADDSPHKSKSKAHRKSKPQYTRTLEGARNFCSLVLGPVFVQAFVLTFLGEWGDRSQIATIALGAAHNVYLVTLGTVLGHSMCTALAVIGGRYVSTKISVKHVTLGGATLFILFGVIYLYEALVDGSADDMEFGMPISVEGSLL
ncbi:hypothetical protein BJ138DRAFT_1155299 [Hygrophoropsis aurantiaca]|uniref:Uncharacterized protein n=1 Tax=Hygrophoropsis aurantiaca TaxID=72124 RepID=A0ACB8A7Q6_9AGAM|nr:hypothetical protein BJ138DRAFT_1155299 [Hygrophoropsis aurantiaca]